MFWTRRAAVVSRKGLTGGTSPRARLRKGFEEGEALGDEGRGLGTFEKGRGGGRGGVEISFLSGLVPLEGEAVRGACGVSAWGSENTSVPASLTASTPQPRAWGSGSPGCPGGGTDSGSLPCKRREVGAQT